MSIAGLSEIRGLTHSQAQEAGAKYGLNEIPERGQRGKWEILIDQFKSPLVALLVVAAGVAALVGDGVDALLILAIVGVNGILGWVQEYKADDAIKKLKKLGGGMVRVMRSEREMEIDVRQVVPGDMVHIEEGGRVPADGRVVWAVELEIDEAVLTGESMPVTKVANSDTYAGQVFSGTLAARGYGWMQVTETGGNTKFGKLAGKLVGIKREETPLEKKLGNLSKVMVGLGIVACVVVALLVLMRGGGSMQAWSNGVSLAVAVIPEGLPAVLSVTLAVGVSKMARQKAVVRKMSAVEALGGATVVATDKTGTITQNVMEVKQLLVGDKMYKNGDTPDISIPEYSRMLLSGILASTAVLVHKETDGEYDVVGDQTEGALLKLAQEEGLVTDLVRSKNQTVVEYPFDSRLRLMSVVVDPDPQGGEKVAYVKGATEEVLKRCDHIMIRGKFKKLNEAAKKKIMEGHAEMAGQALRCLGLAYKRLGEKKVQTKRVEVESGLVWLGLVGIADPLRPETVEILSLAKRAGIKVIMITGDSELTALNISREAGLIDKDEEVITGVELDQMTDEALKTIIGKVRIFARIAPEQKLRIVKAWQSGGDVVVMTGDGVNDALAIKQADVGVAMGRTGTDVARETADVVLLDDNLKTILGAIENGRTIVANITQTVKYLLACNLGEVVTIIGGVALFSDSPLAPSQILWVNLVTDSFPALALAVDHKEPGVMEGRPKTVGRLLVGVADLGWLAVAAGGVGVASLIALAWLGRGAAFTVLVISQMVVALAIRGRRKPNGYLIGAIGFVLILQTLIMAIPSLRGVFKI